MTQQLYVGLMSGTSLDGVDAALVDFSSSLPRLVATHLEPIPSTLKSELLALTQPGDGEIDRMGVSDASFADLQARAVTALLKHSNTHPSTICAIGSHGQTIRHRPEFDTPFTLQIGDPSRIAEHTGITVVADIRRRDMAAGGEGAPLVPAFHEAFLATTTTNRIVINIGGIANVTVLDKEPGLPVLGYDTGPGNVLMDSWIQRHQQLDYDSNGEWASHGVVNQELLQRLLDTPYLKQPPPKSTGRELFHPAWLDQHLSLANLTINDVDIQATLLEFTAQTISLAVLSHNYSELEVYLCGGGARNEALATRIGQLLAPHQVSPTDTLGIPCEWLEACAFAWFAKACLEKQPANLPSVTGAKGRRILGAIYQA